MNKKVKKLLVILCALIALAALLRYLWPLIGRYGYTKWKNRVVTKSIAESKERDVFIRTLNYKIIAPGVSVPGFAPFIERGFRYKNFWSDETVPVANTQYPYQIALDYPRSAEISVLIRRDELHKFDSASPGQGYLKEPQLKDTVYFDLYKSKRIGSVAVW